MIAAEAGASTAGGRDAHVVVNVPRTTPAGSTIYLTGSLPSLCSWKPDCVAMKQVAGNPNAYEAFVAVPEGMTEFEFKVSRGSWKTEAADSWSRALKNFRVQITQSRDVSAADWKPVVVSVAHWADLPPLGLKGHVEMFPDFWSPQLNNSRRILVWLPPGYDQNPERSYPVIYMHDGQNLMDASTSTVGAEWSIDEVMTERVESGQLPPAIVVGMDHMGPQRFDEYTWSIRGKLYGEFVTRTVKPFIDRRYRTMPDRDHTFLMGSSMGAVISFSMLWNLPEVFSAAAGLSLPAFIQDRAVFDVIQQTPPPRQPVRFYMDHGTGGMDESYEPTAREFADRLRQLGLAEPSLSYRVFPYAHHTESDWAARVHIPLQFLFQR